jgi:hypothetical protein
MSLYTKFSKSGGGCENCPQEKICFAANLQERLPFMNLTSLRNQDNLSDEAKREIQTEIDKRNKLAELGTNPEGIADTVCISVQHLRSKYEISTEPKTPPQITEQTQNPNVQINTGNQVGFQINTGGATRSWQTKNTQSEIKSSPKSTESEIKSTSTTIPESKMVEFPELRGMKIVYTKMKNENLDIAYIIPENMQKTKWETKTTAIGTQNTQVFNFEGYDYDSLGRMQRKYGFVSPLEKEIESPFGAGTTFVGQMYRNGELVGTSNSSNSVQSIIQKEVEWYVD